MAKRFHGVAARKAKKCKITRGRNGKLKRVCGGKKRRRR